LSKDFSTNRGKMKREEMFYMINKDPDVLSSHFSLLPIKFNKQFPEYFTDWWTLMASSSF